MHHIHLRARLDPSWRWLTLPYRVEEGEIEKETGDWDVAWRPPTMGSSGPFPKNPCKNKQLASTNLAQSVAAEEEACRVVEALDQDTARRTVEDKVCHKVVEEAERRAAEEASRKKEQGDKAQQDANVSPDPEVQSPSVQEAEIPPKDTKTPHDTIVAIEPEADPTVGTKRPSGEPSTQQR